MVSGVCLGPSPPECLKGVNYTQVYEEEGEAASASAEHDHEATLGAGVHVRGQSLQNLKGPRVLLFPPDVRVVSYT